MSTRCTIAYDDTDFHLYQEVLDNNNIYLQLENGNWDAALETATLDWHNGDRSRPSLCIRIDVTLWRRIVEGWCESSWAKNPDFDHKKPEWNLDDNKWLKGLAKKQAETPEADNSKEEG
jgi:hypothetical protein